MSTSLEVKCDYCGNVIPRTISWEELPGNLNFFCNRNCEVQFKKSGAYRKNIEKELFRELGTAGNYIDIPPKECLEEGRVSCLKCEIPLKDCKVELQKERWSWRTDEGLLNK